MDVCKSCILFYFYVHLLIKNSVKSVQCQHKDLGLKGTIQQVASFDMLKEIYNVL